MSELVGEYYIPQLILGNITIATDGTPTYQTNRYYGAITPNGQDAYFKAGQIVRLKSYELTQGVELKYFVGLSDGQGKYNSSGWLTTDYTIPATGYYCINIQTVPTTNQSSVSAFAGFFEVIDQTARISKIENGLSEVIASEAETSQSIDALSESIGDAGYSIPELRLGNIAIAADGTPTYQVRDYGVITPAGSFCVFQAGTKLSLSDYSNAQFAVGLNLGNGKVTNSGWITSGYYMIQQSGEYFLNIQSKPTTSQSSIDALYSLFTVDASTLSERMTNAEKKITDLQPPELFSLNGIKSIKTINNFWPQGVALVGDNVLMFYASNDAHTNHANVTIYNINDLETQIGYIEHNTGHCASADYNEEKDLLLIANGNYPAPTPTIYLVSDFSNKLAQRDNIEYNGTDVTALVLSSVTSQAVCGCFGETGDILYVVTGADNYDVDFTKTIYQLQIGFGANNMVTKFPSASVGTYQAASDGVPNGTAHIMAIYTVQFPGELQGLKYLNNRLIVLCDSRIPNGVKTPYLVSVQFTKSGAKVTNTYWIPAVNADGTRPAVETEDVLFDGVYGYAEANGKIYKFLVTML